MKNYLPTLALALALTACASAPSSPSVPSTPPLDGESVTYYQNAQGYLSLPEGEGPHPAVILIHEWWGLNDQIRGMADKFADEGYVALAVDLYNGQAATTPEEARTLATSVRENTQEAMANLTAATQYLTSLDSVDEERLASAGWCFGGQWSYEMAKNNMGVDASVMYYGRFNEEDDLEQMTAHIQGHFGEDDTGIPVDDVKAFRAKLQTLSGEHQIFIYENAGHAFMNEDSDSYREESAEKAWERTMDFLEEVL